jgi:4-amino-4-deoxy-L-arabinose transferase-like glycosyltransferase
MGRNKLLFLFLLLLLVSTAAFFSFNSRVHLFDWDEINFAESAREMIVTGDYLTVRIDYQPFWEKPPLFIAMQAVSMQLFGINEMAARLPNTLAGIFTLILLFFTGKKFFSARFGLIWCMAYVASFLPFLYFKSGLIDPWFNLFIFSGVVCFIVYDQQGRRYRWLILSAFLVGLAVLTKGPVALPVTLLTAGIVFLLRRFRNFIPMKGILVWCVVVIMTGGLWFLMMALSGRAETIKDFFLYQMRLFRTEDAGHGGFPLFHVIVLLVGVFPASVMALPSFFKDRSSKGSQQAFRRWMLVLFWVVLILFSIVKTKIVHYSSLCYFPLTFLAALEVIFLIENSKKLSRGITFMLAAIMMIWVLFALLAPMALGPFKGTLLRLLSGSDPASLAMVGAEIAWPWYTLVPGAALLLTLVLFLSVRLNVTKRMIILTAGSFIFINTAIWFFSARVEGYSQQANIEFFKGLEGKDVYTRTLGIKSYANFFYFKKRPPVHPIEYSKNWQLFGPVDKPVYCSFSLNRKEDYLKRYYTLEFLYEKNGYVFCVRKPPKYQKP